MKDKEWLKEQTKRLGEVPASGNDYFQEGWFEAYESFNKLIDQLDEPNVSNETVNDILDANRKLSKRVKELEIELPVIPQFVADYIDRKQELMSMFCYSYLKLNEEYKNIYDWISDNQETFARAWLEDYKIEQPKLLTAIVKDYDKTIMSKQLPEDEVNKMMEGLEK